MELIELKLDRATPIELNVWKDPQGFVIVEHVRDEAWLYFKCWEPEGTEAPYVGCLHFEGVWHVESSRFQRFRGYPDVEDTDLISYYLIVANSTLLTSLQSERASHSPEWRVYDKRVYKHWIVESHDFYTDIVATSASFSLVTGENASRLFEIWNKV